MVQGFLQARGYHVEQDLPERNGQTIVGTSPAGSSVRIRVRLCWRMDEKEQKSDGPRQFSAAQILPRVKGDDWVGSLNKKVEREQGWGITHYLFVQRIGEAIHHAGLIPASELVPIWIKQRDKSRELIESGKLGNRKKNHAMNGSSPTIWLRDDPDGTEVAEQFWSHPGVVNLMNLEVIGDEVPLPEELHSPEKLFEGAIQRIAVNAYERNRKARDLCIQKRGARCAVCKMEFRKVYGPEVAGLIHVHHLKPISKIGKEYQLDPENDLLPVCPNCHAVIHFGGKCRTVEEVKEMLIDSPGP